MTVVVELVVRDGRTYERIEYEDGRIELVPVIQRDRDLREDFVYWQEMVF